MVTKKMRVHCSICAKVIRMQNLSLALLISMSNGQSQ